MALAIVLAAVKGIIAWFVLMFIGTNLIGMAVGGLAHPIHGLTSDLAFLSREVAKSRAVAYVSSLFFCVLVVVYLAAIWRYLSPGAAVAAAMLMLARIPDVLQEIRTAERITATNMSKNALDYVTTALAWLALPVLCFSFY